MKTLLSALALVVTVAVASWADGPLVTVENPEPYRFWYVLDPEEFADLQPDSPELIDRVAVYLTADTDVFSFEPIESGQMVVFAGLPVGVHYLFGFFESDLLDDLPVQLVAFEVSEADGDFGFQVLSIPELFMVARGIGRLAGLDEALAGLAAREAEAAVAEEVAVEEAVVEEASPAEEVAVEETAVEEAVVEEAVAEEDAPVEEAVVEQASPAEEVAVEETAVEEAAVVEEAVAEEAAPVEEAAAEEAAPVEEAVVEQASPAEEVAVEEAVVEEAAAVEEAVAEEAAPVEEAAAEQAAPVEEAVVEQASPAEEVAVEEAVVEEAAPVEEVVVEEAAPVEEVVAEEPAPEVPPAPEVLASFSEYYDPVYFTRETRDGFIVLPIASSRAWGKAGTRLSLVSGMFDQGTVTLTLRCEDGFAPNVSFFLYAFPERVVGRGSPFTFEARPDADGRSAVVLWIEGDPKPRLVGSARTEGGEFTWTVDAAELPMEVVAEMAPGTTFDLTTAWLDEASATWEEFYFTSFAVADLTR